MQRFYHYFFRFMILLTSSSLVVNPPVQALTASCAQQTANSELEYLWDRMSRGDLITYDEVIDFLHQIESGTLDYLPSEEWDKIQDLLTLFARNGILPDDPAGEAILEEDIQELLQGDNNSYEQAYSLNLGGDYLLQSAVFYGDGHVMPCRSWIAKKCRQIKHYVKKHKTAIIIGTVVVVAAVVAVYAVAAVSATKAAAAAAAGAIGAAGADKGTAHSKDTEQASTVSAPPNSDESSSLESALTEHISSFKEVVAEGRLLEPSNEQPAGAFEAQAKDLAAILAHTAFDEMKECANPSQATTAQMHVVIDQVFSQGNSNERWIEGTHQNDTVLAYLDKAIEHNPNNKDAYLTRANTLLQRGEIARAAEDFSQYQEITEQSFSWMAPIEFGKGFTKGLAKGAVEGSGAFCSLAKELATHPIATSQEIYHGISSLASIAGSAEWEALSQAIVPEIHQLVTQWDNLSYEARGELAGQTIGKVGVDFLAPGAVVRLTKEASLGAKKALDICTQLQKVEKVAAVEIGLAEVTTSNLARIERFEVIEHFIANDLQKIDKTAKIIEDFLGGEGKIITNADGDIVLMRGNRKIRFDVKDPHGDKPHFHLEEKTPAGKWIDVSHEHRYYFTEE